MKLFTYWSIDHPRTSAKLRRFNLKCLKMSHLALICGRPRSSRRYSSECTPAARRPIFARKFATQRVCSPTTQVTHVSPHNYVSPPTPTRVGKVSNKRLIITAVAFEGRSQAQVARAYNVSQAWVSKLMTRYRTEGDTAFQPRSRSPKTRPHSTPTATIELVIKVRRSLTESVVSLGQLNNFLVTDSC